MSITILCTGDAHLGRRPTRVPEGMDPHALGPAAAWDAFVEAALETRADAVALTGDMVDEENRFYEAYSVLQAGVERLVEAGIPIYAVAGNHDYEVLPRLADRFKEGFHLLGRGGQWTEAVLESAGRPVLRMQGWSFPERHVERSALHNYKPPADDLPTVGLLHCDCDAPGSRYGPVALAELRATPVAAWLLGHIHKPDTRSPDPPLVLYTGSPQGLDPAEPGPHGAWKISLEAGRLPRAEPLLLARLRWEQIDVPMDAVRDKQTLDEAVFGAIRRRHDDIRKQLACVRAVGCRLRLRGRTPFHPHLAGELANMESDLSTSLDNVAYFVEKVEDFSRPDLALEEIARSNDPAGLVARRLLLLEGGAPARECEEFIRSGREALEQARGARKFAGLRDSSLPVPDEAVRALLVQAGFSVLEALLGQKEGRT